MGAKYFTPPRSNTSERKRETVFLPFLPSPSLWTEMREEAVRAPHLVMRKKKVEFPSFAVDGDKVVVFPTLQSEESWVVWGPSSLPSPLFENSMACEGSPLLFFFVAKLM